MNDDLRRLFSEESAVIMMSGGKGDGKTDFALRMGEEAYEEGLIQRIGTNMRTDDERVEHVGNLPDLKSWLSLKGDKYFMLDEAGKVINRMRFMSTLSVMIMGIIQLVRHYDATFTAIAPSETFIDSNFLNTDILDCKIKKIGLEFAEVKNFLTRQVYTLGDIERTNIRFWSKDVATFTLKKPFDVKSFSPEERCALAYSKGMSMDTIGKSFETPMHRQQVARSIRKYLSLHFSPLKTCHKLPT